MSVYETIKMSPLLGLQGSGGGLAYLAGLAGGDKTYVDDVFSTFLYTGTGNAKTITNGIDLAGEGGLVWLKSRSLSEANILGDTETGITKRLSSNSTTTQAVSNMLTSANSDGFTLGTSNVTNTNNSTNVSWTFRKAPGFFDVVTWSGNATNRTISHNLGSVPGMIIVKNITAGYNWAVYHRSVGTSKLAFLNQTAEFDAKSYITTIWNNTSPTSTHFTVGTGGLVNASGDNYVAYVFAHDDAQFGTGGNESIVKCGSYTATGSLQEIDLGFEPQWVMIKNSSRIGNSASDWVIFDSMRGMMYDQDSPYLKANVTSAPGAGKVGVSATGLIIDEATVPIGTSGDTYVYMAIRRPNKPPELATEVFGIDTGNSSSTTPCWDSGFPVDFAIMSKPSTNYPRQVGTRLMGTKYLSTNYSNAEANDPDFTWDSNLGWGKSWNSLMYSWMFKRAPGFMDVVTYSGTGSSHSVTHNLNSTPGFIIVKSRDFAEDWMCYFSGVGATKYLLLNGAAGTGTTPVAWNDTEPTSNNFTVGTISHVNSSGKEYIAILFATLPGISKVGSYTGNGSTLNVDCGFTNGARFVMIKRTDGTGDWYVWDSVRGIVSGNDPYLLLNTNAAQVTNTDYIDPLSTGFTVTSSAPAALNASGGTYLFLAIA